MKAKTPGCPACRHVDAATLDRHLLAEQGTAWRRSPRSLAPLFGLSRRVIVKHAQRCLVGERRERALAGMWKLAERAAPEAVARYREREGGGGA